MYIHTHTFFYLQAQDAYLAERETVQSLRKDLTLIRREALVLQKQLLDIQVSDPLVQSLSERLGELLEKEDV